MGKPLPMALRKGIVTIVDEGTSNREASRNFRGSAEVRGRSGEVARREELD
jgi:hypothetical protein